MPSARFLVKSSCFVAKSAVAAIARHSKPANFGLVLLTRLGPEQTRSLCHLILVVDFASEKCAGLKGRNEPSFLAWTSAVRLLKQSQLGSVVVTLSDSNVQRPVDQTWFQTRFISDGASAHLPKNFAWFTRLGVFQLNPVGHLVCCKRVERSFSLISS